MDPPKPEKAAWVVFDGHRRGVFYHWWECELHTTDYPDACYRGYDTVEEAEASWCSYASRTKGFKTKARKPAPAEAPAHEPTPAEVPAHDNVTGHESDAADVAVYGDETGDWYAVAKGRRPGIYTDWDDCHAQIGGFPGSRHKKCDTREEAAKFVRENTWVGYPPGFNGGY